jgi:hypothetical protein
MAKIRTDYTFANLRASVELRVQEQWYVQAPGCVDDEPRAVLAWLSDGVVVRGGVQDVEVLEPLIPCSLDGFTYIRVPLADDAPVLGEEEYERWCGEAFEVESERDRIERWICQVRAMHDGAALRHQRSPDATSTCRTASPDSSAPITAPSNGGTSRASTSSPAGFGPARRAHRAGAAGKALAADLTQ